MNELEVLKKELPEMVSIMNALPGDRFDMKSAQTILIVQRRMEQSELSKQLGIFAQLLSKNEPATMDDLVAAAVAYIRIKTLVEGNETGYSPVIVRDLVKEYKTQQTKLKNILRLSKVNILTAESYQRAVIEKTILKSERFLSAFEKEIQDLEEVIAKEPKSLIKPKEPDPITEDVKELPTKPRKFRGIQVPQKIIGFWEEVQKKNQVTQELKEEEARYASSRCREIPFYDSTLNYSDKYICKDVPAFSLYKRRESIYFGKTENGAAGIYNNRDKSLFELMNVNEDFVQFMTTDLLSGEYQLTPFSGAEKEAMEVYFNFICACFEAYIGKLTTVMEYLKFKDYYNRLMLMRISLEEKQVADYYRALRLADSYMEYMRGYAYSEAKASRREAEEMVHRYESEREELIALREFAYQTQQEEEIRNDLPVEEMKAAIKGKKIAIIGGHVNWHNKLKQQFPGWRFVLSEASKTVDGKMLEGCEKVYFYTDHMSHVIYGKFIAAVRERKIPFGYLGSIHIESVIKQVYGDIVNPDRYTTLEDSDIKERTTGEEELVGFLEEDISECFPPIAIDFGVIITIALELKRMGYEVTEVFGNGFSVFTKTKMERKRLKKDIYEVGDSLIHCDNERISNHREEVEARVWEVKSQIVEETMTTILGKEPEEFAYLWYDEEDNVRGYADTEEECIEQARHQACTKFRIMDNI